MRDTGRFLMGAVCLAAVAVLVHPCPGAEILLPTQKPISLDDMIVVAKNANPSGGVVWLNVYDNNTNEEAVISGIVSLGESLSFSGVDLTVNKIYAGSEEDLVAIDVQGLPGPGDLPGGAPRDALQDAPQGAPRDGPEEPSTEEQTEERGSGPEKDAGDP